jgi:DNA-directed RNA polymerase subunit RPC12/RpoP
LENDQTYNRELPFVFPPKVINLIIGHHISGGRFMKFGKFFGKEKAKPEETIVCPYCGYKVPKRYVQNLLGFRHCNDADWMSRYKCERCRWDFWVVGKYGEVKYAKPFSDTSFAHR